MTGAFFVEMFKVLKKLNTIIKKNDSCDTPAVLLESTRTYTHTFLWYPKLIFQCTIQSCTNATNSFNVWSPLILLVANNKECGLRQNLNN